MIDRYRYICSTSGKTFLFDVLLQLNEPIWVGVSIRDGTGRPAVLHNSIDRSTTSTGRSTGSIIGINSIAHAQKSLFSFLLVKPLYDSYEQSIRWKCIFSRRSSELNDYN